MKLLLIFILFFVLLNAAEMGTRGGGCVLAQEGKVSVVYDAKVYSDARYKANAKSGKNFREIFIGSEINISDKITMKIVDYVPNKRMKGKPKTGIFLVDVTLAKDTKSVTMAYIFDKGIMNAIGVFNKSALSFSTKVNYSLCSVKLK